MYYPCMHCRGSYDGYNPKCDDKCDYARAVQELSKTKDSLAKNKVEVEQMMKHIFSKDQRYRVMTCEHEEVLCQFLNHTGLNAERLKECLTKGYLTMFEESIGKGIKDALEAT